MLKFPKVHIAESVVNRILNVADDLPSPGLASASLPNVPDVAGQSVNLDKKLAEPLPGALPGLDQAPDPGATAGGKPLLATMLDPGNGGG